MEAKVDSSQITFVSYKEAGNIIVTISWECSSDACALNSLKCRTGCTHKNVADTALSLAMIQGMEQELIGTPRALKKMRVGEVHYGVQNNMFSFSYSTKASKTVLLRTLKACVKAMRPAKYASAAASMLKDIGQSCPSEVRNTLVDSLQKSLAKGLSIFVIGSMKLVSKKDTKSADEILKDILKTALEYMSPPKEVGDKKPYTPKGEEENKENENGTEFSASGMDVVWLYSYLHNKLGIDPARSNKGLMVPIGDAKRKQLAKKKMIDAFVDAKFGPLKDDLTAVACYYASIQCLTDARTLAKASNGVTVEAIKSSIAKHM